jgi:hypothetical protein
MATYKWICSHMQMILSKMTISMADTTIEHFKFNIIVSNITSVYPDRSVFFSIFLNAPSNFLIFIILNRRKLNMFSSLRRVHLLFYFYFKLI